MHILLLLLACGNAPAPTASAPAPAPATASIAPPPAAKPAAPKAPAEMTVADIAVGSKDHTTLVAALKQAGLVDALASPGGVYTVFAPTNAAFDALPAGTVDTLMKPENKDKLKKILMHHAGVPITQKSQMTEGASMTMSDGTKVTFHVKDGKTMVEDATILGEVDGRNGNVYVVDKVIVPAG